MRSRTGTLMMIDLDSFKLINDIYGHDGGDKILVAFSSILKSNMRSDDIVGRAGGDEFLAFITGHNEKSISGLTERFNAGILQKAKEFFGDDMKVPLGVSVGAVYSQAGDELSELYKMADEALYDVKLNGKHSYRIYSDMQKDEKEGPDDIEDISRVLEERNAGNYALWLGQDAFSNIYRFIIRYIQSYHSVAYRLLFTVVSAADESKPADPDSVSAFGEVLNKSLRKSDIMMQSRPHQFMLILPEMDDNYISKTFARLMNTWQTSENYYKVKIDYEYESITAPSN
jgi:diguanylate cyclase (GGDEF)-like protein